MAKILIIFFVFLHVSICEAGIILQFDPAHLTVMSNGSNQSFNVDLLITHNGFGDNTISGFTLDITDPSSGLTISNPTTSPYTWDFASPDTSFGGGLYTIGAASFSNNTIPNNGTATLATMTFNLDSSVVSQVFSLDLTLRDAARDFFDDIASEVTVVDSNFTVQSPSAAVPEPSSFAALTLVGGLISYFRFRRRKHQPAS